MQDGMLYLPGKVAAVFMALGAGLSWLAERPDNQYSTVLILCGGAFLGLLIFGAAMPLIAWWILLRKAGYGFWRRVILYSRMLLIMLAIAAAFAVFHDTTLFSIWTAVGVILIPWTIADIIKARQLVEIKGAGLPQVRR